MQTINSTTTPVVIFTATHPGIFAVEIEAVSGETILVSSRVGQFLSTGSVTGAITYLDSGDTVSAFSPSTGSANVALVRLGDEF